MLHSCQTQQIWLSSSTPGSGWGGIGLKSGLYQRLKKIILTYSFSACAGHNELEEGECLSHKKAQLKPYTVYNSYKGGIIQRAGCLIR